MIKLIHHATTAGLAIILASCQKNPPPVDPTPQVDWSDSITQYGSAADLINYSNYSATTVNGDVRFYTPDLKKGAPRLFIDANVQHQLGLQTEFSGYARVGEMDQNIGVGYRSSGALMAIIQASVSTIQIAYSFEYTFTDIQSYTAGGHFIALRKVF